MPGRPGEDAPTMRGQLCAWPLSKSPFLSARRPANAEFRILGGCPLPCRSLPSIIAGGRGVGGRGQAEARCPGQPGSRASGSPCASLTRTGPRACAAKAPAPVSLPPGCSLLDQEGPGENVNHDRQGEGPHPHCLETTPSFLIKAHEKSGVSLTPIRTKCKSMWSA